MKFELDSSQGLLVVNLARALSKDDFANLSQLLDAYYQTHPMLQGLLLRTQHFPGWENFSAFRAHLNFIKSHHRRIQRVAIVTDAFLGSLAKYLAGYFVAAELRQFAYQAEADARLWLTQQH